MKWVSMVFIMINLMLYPTLLEHSDSVVVRLFKIDKKYEEKVKENNRFRITVRFTRRIP